MPRNAQARNVQTNLMIKRFDSDTVKEDALRTKMLNKGMVRRDERGNKVADNVFKNDKGPPPKKPKKPKKP